MLSKHSPWYIKIPHTTINYDFSKGSTWLKCSHWPKGCSKGMGHERHMILLVGYFDWSDHFDHVLSRTSNQGQNI
jgi:hypothetical protein